MSDETATFSPPYNVPWATFVNTLLRIANESPTKVDRSYLASTAGTVQTYLIAAFRGFGLIDAESRPTEALDEFSLLATEKQPEFIGDLLRSYYPTIVSVGERNSTPGELNEAFAEAFPTVTGESRVKALRFYLAGVEFAGLPKSPLWKLPKASPSGPRKASARSKPKPQGERLTPERSTAPDMKKAYFDLLLKKAEEAGDATDLLDRIERLVGLDPKPAANNEGA